MDSPINMRTAPIHLTVNDFDRVAENIAMSAPPARRITSREFVIAKKAELLQCIASGHTKTSLAAAMKANGVPPIAPQRLGELLELPRRGKNKSSTKKSQTSGA